MVPTRLAALLSAAFLFANPREAAAQVASAASAVPLPLYEGSSTPTGTVFAIPTN